MHLQDRWKLIIDELNPDRVTSVDELTSRLGVSPATIRRDLNELHELGHLLRVRGGAMRVEGKHFNGKAVAEAEPQKHRLDSLTGQSSFLDSTIVNAPVKRAIARAALDYLRPGISMIIDGGTTTYTMANMMANEPYHVLTTSIPILQCLLDRSKVKVTLPGGELFREQRIILNPYEDGMLQNFSAAKIFIGCQALTKNGLMQSDTLLVQSERRLMERADQVILLADSSKIDAPASLSVCPLTAIDVVVTDEGITPAARGWLENAGIEVRIARVTADDLKAFEVV
ncbi:DeoR/GlpR family DNA-binding transcription regulator [Asticcacaulis sp. BYS171W]|uniref:DeoR/GlpR family DNA-binding transcription regulator n=1 Tax=Asticcacaulis aquaticus TaxID=2984212 RepID=A0ABT5HY00_9CAUL|nr:DeoR/GlpR family DNA-binding transcription regulator [Asticcacaulis aquaticus]MDC7684955.1 DeoR/GlpR family DNA-binding transcription regulator [Asticcacaulis aquaticus]